MAIKDILLILLPLIAALGSSYLTYFFAIRSKKEESMRRFKEEKYSNLVILLQGFVGKTISGELKKQFFEEQYRSWLYCSDDVVKAINDLIALLMASRGRPDPKKGKEVIGSIILAMRRDMLGKTKLDHSHFFYTDVLPDNIEKPRDDE